MSEIWRGGGNKFHSTLPTDGSIKLLAWGRGVSKKNGPTAFIGGPLSRSWGYLTVLNFIVKFAGFIILKIKPCGLGSRTQDVCS